MNPLTQEQQEIINTLFSFLEKENEHIFIVKGAAGSGKTTLIKYLIDKLKENQKLFKVMAPTGRASKVLRDKGINASTIHRGIYNFEDVIIKEVENPDDSKKSYHYIYPLHFPNENGEIVIIDEASMVSDVETKHELFTFGSGKLLSDVIQYANFSNRYSKLIFVGDNAQLPPVTDNESKALSVEYFQSEHKLNVQEAELTTIHRQLVDSTILQNANEIRNLLKKPKEQRNTFELLIKNEVEEISNIDLTSHFTDKFPEPKIGNGVIVCYSNQGAYQYNQSIREKIFPNSPNVSIGDILMVINNNYNQGVFNGDMATVTEVSADVEEIKNIPVYEKGKKIYVNFSFRNVKLKFPHLSEEVSCKIIDSLLNSPYRDLNVTEMKALYINFVMRFREKYPQYKEGSQEFKEALKTDLYFNALRVKYGYAITCHKSQGGEWDSVYVDYSGRIGLYDDALRWCYTATTRAKKELFVINPPKINGFHRLEIRPITKIGKIGKEFYQNTHTFSTPFHTENAHIALRLKYQEVESKLRSTPFSIDRIVSSNYLEKYFFKIENEIIQIDWYYDGAGIFKTLQNRHYEIENQLIETLNAPFYHEFAVNYSTENSLFKELYNRILTACSECEVQITNIVEHEANFHINYYLKTDAKFAYLQCYFTKDKGFTSVLPFSEQGSEDVELQKLVNFINQN
ncbi:ATP-dependent DNA helicase [Capnocytophaga canis]|uniref:RecD-like DNA helicase n=1 Tax=Capnocytophaga canis TaxID=1848903 RepID=A0A0B7HYD8_9FLAO|nr:AAA family ATPase [Capnocytophaga canis]CEN44435.1 RecD-like DNA helicase [Capnocytophaga canis]